MRRVKPVEGPQITIEFEGKPLSAQQGDSVAAALLAGDHRTFRTTPVNGVKRGPFCMMGVCFDCLVEINGVANCQACMVEVSEGMRIKRQKGASDITIDFGDDGNEGAP